MVMQMKHVIEKLKITLIEKAEIKWKIVRIGKM